MACNGTLDLKYVQTLLGHASIGLTLDLYSNWASGVGKQTASAMDDALDEADRQDDAEEGKNVLEK